jgi:hypothetical protein
MSKANESAFPKLDVGFKGGIGQYSANDPLQGGQYFLSGGMTKLEVAAIAAMPAAYAHATVHYENRGWPEDWRQRVAAETVLMARALFAELEKQS